ncbi:CHAT domain-containing protein [Sphaerisporangium sp. NBC_01403]|uniref:CHAT domain-containing protein n=1 Tax=Sphaerisporangium sp. NBC_01403 TaxID=2903599 RepID=UPI003244FD94
MAERPGDRVWRRFTGTASPLIGGEPCPDVEVSVEWGDSPLFMLSSPGQAPGSLLWVVAGDDDAQVTSDDAGVTVTLGPLQGPTAPPIWWAAVVSPMGAGFDLPIEARAGTARMSVHGDLLSGIVRFSGVALDGRPVSYEATVTGRAAGHGEVPAAPVEAQEEPAGDPSSPINRLNALSGQISLDFAAGHLGALVGHLREAAGLRRELSVGDAVTGAWGRFLAGVRESLAFDRQVLASIAARGHLGDLVAAADSEIASTAGLIGRLDPAPYGPAGLAGGVAEAAGALARVPVRLRALVERALAAGFVDPVDDLAVALTGAAERLEHHRDHLERLDPVGHARRTREGNTEATARMARYVEQWRARAGTDWDRIQMMEEAGSFLGDLPGLFLDLGDGEAALVASEMARARAFADLMSGRRPAPVLTPARMSALLGEYGGPVVEYFLRGDRLVVFVAGPHGMETADLRVDRGALRGWVDELHRHLRAETLDRARVRELLRLLGGVLWDPVARWLPRDPETAVALVPHEELLRVPFHALVGAGGPHLAERHTTTVLPAASILPALMARRTGAPAAPPRLCALVDPEPMPGGLPPLPLLRERFGVVSGLFAGAEINIGAAATLAAMVEGAAVRPSVLCLATHAQALPDDPMASYVALAGGELTARAVHELDLPARLVVLAACETGAGRVTGDGVIGLSRAFLAAGPLAVLMTLWPVRERDSLRVLRRFCDLRLNGGLGTAQALRAAQRSMFTGRSDDPRDWAAFTLFGLPD